MPWTQRKADAERTWTIQVKLPPQVEPQRAGRFMAMVLKRMWRWFGVKCVVAKDTEPAERVST